MAYVVTNPPVRKSQYPLTSFGSSQGAGGATWKYLSTDAIATVQGAGYFTNGAALGMQVGDIVECHQPNAAPYKIDIAIVASISAAGAASLGTTNIATLR